jgi:hypothetical protein
MKTYSFEAFITAALLTAATVVVGCSAKADTGPEAPIPLTSAPQITALGKQSEFDVFEIAYGQANQAVSAAATAATTDDWAVVKDQWTTAIDLMALVPETSPNRATAQEKTAAYQDNLRHAEKQWAEHLVVDAAGYLDSQGQWTDRDKGRPLYDALKALDGEVVTAVLVSQIRRPDHRKQVLFLSVKLGIQQSEEALVNALMRYGNEVMAEDFLNSGSTALAEGGERWAIARGYEVIHEPGGSHRATWGSF